MSGTLRWQDLELRMRPHWPEILTLVFALAWIFHRASAQSITLDEATTYHYWVAAGTPTHWEPHSNNHVLNSTLMRLSIWLFGLSGLTARAPALLGGTIYMLAVYGLCRLLVSAGLLRWVLIVCFIYNPFIMDYLVAARGYGLALGFLMLAIFLFARVVVEERSQRDVRRHLMAISACVGLAICANFSFAYASTALLVVAAAFAGVMLFRQGCGALALGRLAVACALPALAVTVVLAGSALTRFPRDQLFWGVNSLAESWHDIRHACFDELNPYLFNPLLASGFETLQQYVFPALAVVGAAYLGLFILDRRRRRDSRTILAECLTTVLALTVLAHWLQFKLFKIPLPYERTSIFVVPLATALVAAVLSASTFDWKGRAVRTCGVGILLFSGLYFIGELRDSHFREWRNCADIKAAFPVLADLCRRAGVREVVSDLNFTGSFNFYRDVFKATEMDELANFDPPPPGKTIYVLMNGVAGDFIRKEGLQVYWHGLATDLVIAVSPGTMVTVRP